jgi:DNA modification methylase
VSQWPEWTSPDGRIRLINADCLEVLPHVEADAVVTDIPYNCSQVSGGLRTLDYGDWDKGFEVGPFIAAVLPMVSACYVWCHEKQLSGLLLAYEKNGWIDRPLFWIKPNPTVINGQHVWLPGAESCAFGKRRGSQFNEHCHPGYWFTRPDRDRFHPNQKPVRVISEQVEASTSDGETILDPFAGSCTTAIACIRTERRCICIEKEAKYWQIGIDRCKAEYARTALIEEAMA